MLHKIEMHGRRKLVRKQTCGEHMLQSSSGYQRHHDTAGSLLHTLSKSNNATMQMFFLPARNIFYCAEADVIKCLLGQIVFPV